MLKTGTDSRTRRLKASSSCGQRPDRWVAAERSRRRRAWRIRGWGLGEMCRGESMVANRQLNVLLPRREAPVCILPHLLAIEADEIHRIKQQRREAAIADRCRDNLACERKEQARTFDQYERIETFLRDVADAKYPCKFQFEPDSSVPSLRPVALKLNRDLNIGIR